MDLRNIVIMIPAYDPDEKLLLFLRDLKNAGAEKIILINDGSRSETKPFFQTAYEEYGCDIVEHAINLGKGRACKSGFNRYLSAQEIYADTLGIVQCDCDGQHHAEDVVRCAELLQKNPDKFILGIRSFSGKQVPFRSRFGNKCTAFLFKLFCGLDIEDTQTGLKGFPAFLIPAFMEAPGERFEYDSSVLLETRRHDISILQFPIQTIYIKGNESSHFHPILDSIRIYFLILRYLLGSLTSFLIDILLFSLFISLFSSVSGTYYIILSVYLAKMCSCTFNHFLNKKPVFRRDNSSGTKSGIRFFIWCIFQSTVSGLLIDKFVQLSSWSEVLCKIIVDIILFFISFQIQNRWVFQRTIRNPKQR